MMYTHKRLVFLFALSTVLFASCTSGLKPLPSKIDDLSLSLSLPLAKVEVGFPGLYHIGDPNYFLTENVPDWARYDYLYFTDRVAVDLTRIYENATDISLLAFKINIWNGFKAKCVANIYFVDNAGNVIYTFDPIAVEDGDPIQNGTIVKPGYSQSSAIFDKDQIEDLRSAEFLVFDLKVDITGSKSYFQFFDQYKMDCQVGARVDFILKDI